MTQERQSLRLARSQLRETLEESRDQVGVHGGPGLRGVGLASDRLRGTSPAKGVAGLAEATQLGGALQAEHAVRPRPGSGGTPVDRVKGCASRGQAAIAAPLGVPSAGGGAREHGRWPPRSRPRAEQPPRAPAPHPRWSPGVTTLWHVCGSAAHCPALHLSSACQAQRCGGEARSPRAGTHRCEQSGPRRGGGCLPA